MSKFRGFSTAAAITVVIAGMIYAGPTISQGATVTPPTPSAPFTECPTIGADTSCGILIWVTDSGTYVLGDASQGPYDGSDDTLIGVLNQSSSPVSSIPLTSQGADLFDFDGDGICTFATGGSYATAGFTGDSYCDAEQISGTDPFDYEGPDNTFSNISSDFLSGTVDFTTPVAPGASTYFALEDALSTTPPNNVQIGGLIVSFGDSVSAGEGNAAPSNPGPTGLSAKIASSGQNLPAGVYQYEVTAVSPSGETYGSSEISIIPIESVGSISITWNAVASATQYNVYGRAPNSDGKLGLIGTVSASTSPTSSFVDNGRKAPSTKVFPPTPYEGFSRGFSSDSPNAYPAVLAQQLGFGVDNFSISGSCASNAAKNTTKLPNCSSSKPSVLEGELKTAASMNLSPTIVTLTIGGNDVNFEACFPAVLAIKLKKSLGTCSDGAKSLLQIQSNVTSVLEQINVLYPNVPIVLTQYYDPLPTVDSGLPANSICSQHKWIYAAYQYDHGQTLGALNTIRTNDSGGAGIAYLNKVFANSQNLVNGLNSSLAKAAIVASGAGVNVTLVPLMETFLGHDMCQDYSGGNTGYLFGPSLSVQFEDGGVHKTYSYIAVDNCAFPDAGCAGAGPTKLNGSLLGIPVHVTYAYNLNDLPHPTQAGQQAIANYMYSQIASLTP
jgi:lysophospholipase L1-like esterase